MAFTIAVTPQSLAMPGTESNTRASNADVESFPLYTISQSVDLNSSKGDDTSIDPLVCAITRRHKYHSTLTTARFRI